MTITGFVALKLINTAENLSYVTHDATFKSRLDIAGRLIHTSADSLVDCVDAEIGIFLSLRHNATIAESADCSF